MIRPENLNRKENKKVLNTGGNIGAAIGSTAAFIPGVGPVAAPVVGAVGSAIGGKIGSFLGGGKKEPEVQATKTRATMGYKYGGKYKRHLKYNVGGNLPSAAQPIGPDAVKYDGPQHEQGGIPIDEAGNPTDDSQAVAEVEGNETRQGDFIFSDELMIPGGEISFAEAHEMLLEEGAGEEQIEQLAQMQEQVKQEQGIDNEGGAPMEQQPMEQAPMPQEQPQGQSWGEAGMMKKGGKVSKYPLGGTIDPQNMNNFRNQFGSMKRSPQNVGSGATKQMNRLRHTGGVSNTGTNPPSRLGSIARTGAKRLGTAGLVFTAGNLVGEGIKRLMPSEQEKRRHNQFMNKLEDSVSDVPSMEQQPNVNTSTQKTHRQLPGLGGQEREKGMMNSQVFPQSKEEYQPRGLVNLQGSDRSQIPQTRQEEEDAKVEMQNVQAPSNNPKGSNRPSAPNNRPEDVLMEPNPNDVLYGKGVGSKDLPAETFGSTNSDPVSKENVSSKVETGKGANEGRDWASIAQRALPSIVNAATAATAPKPKETPKMQARTMNERNPAFAAGRNRNASAFRANPTQGGHAQFTQANNQLTAQEAQDRTRREEFNNQAETRADQFNIQNEVRDNEATAQDQAARIQMITRAIQDPLDQIAADRRGKDQMRATVAMAAASIENEVERANFLNQVLSLIEGGAEAEEAIEQARGRN